MTIEKNTSFSGFDLVCDVCGESAGRGFLDFCDTVNYRKANYWKSQLGNTSNNTITGNTCQSNLWNGIWVVTGLSNTITGNVCQNNGKHGVHLGISSDNVVIGNTCQNNSQETHDTYNNIYLENNSMRGGEWEDVCPECQEGE